MKRPPNPVITSAADAAGAGSVNPKPIGHRAGNIRATNNSRSRLWTALVLGVAFGWQSTAWGQQDFSKQGQQVLAGQVDNGRLYRNFLQNGIRLVEELKTEDQAPANDSNSSGVQPTDNTSINSLTMPQIAEALVKNRRPVEKQLSQISPSEPVSPQEAYQRILKSSLMLGTIYDCGKCDNLHANVAGAVVISKDGLALTNYHVLDRDESGVEAMLATDFQGQRFTIQDVLYANKSADVALIQLAGDGPFFPAPLAQEIPLPNTPVQVLSHPSGQYYVLTSGVVSRHVMFRRRRDTSTWMEITAAFGGGSSGSGVFDSNGCLVGLVSRIQPLYRRSSSGPQSPADPDESESQESEPSSRQAYVEMVLRRCVTLENIRGCFQ